MIVGNNTYLNNDTSSNSTGSYSPVTGDGSTNSGGISADPLCISYVSLPNQDYHLKYGSPCFDAATATGAPDHDFDVLARPQRARYDIGAYEFQ
jgi:hypothetical protein